MSVTNRIRILTWNVRGFGEKKKDPDFVNILTRYDLICFMETWSSIQTNVKLQNYCKPLHRYRHKKRKKGRKSGGILVYFKKHLEQGIKEMPKTHEDILWLKLDKDFFSFSSHVYLCAAYVPPQSSQSANSTYLQMQKDIARFSKYGDIMLCGDLNARTGCLKDYIEHDSVDRYVDNTQDYSVDIHKHNIPRCNNDTVVTARGRDLIDFCKGAGLRILNGRTLGDLFGDYTCIKENGGKSVVDYNIVSKNFLSNIVYFRVGDPTEFSDHCPLEAFVKCTIDSNFVKPEHNSMKAVYDRFVWRTESDFLYRQAMNDTHTLASLRHFVESQYGNNDTDVAVNDFTSILVNTGLRVLKLKQAKSSQLDNSKVKRPWFDTDCYELRRNIRCRGRAVRKSKSISDNIRQFNVSCKKYKKLLRDKKREYKHRLLKEMGELRNANPKLYWQILKKLKECDSEGKVSDASNISAEEWYRHFSTLATNDESTQSVAGSQNNIDRKLLVLEENRYAEHLTKLDFPFTISEIKAAIKSSKNGKSSSDDLLLNEMIKSSMNTILPALTKLFNLILGSEKFPKVWNIAYQVPLFKGGDLFNTGDFRGISITSCLGKIFNKCLNSRLQSMIEQDKKLADTQAAYRTEFSTIDQIFILKSLINKYTIRGKKKLFGCFVDFKKAFDSVWHNGLLFKLLDQYQIGGKFYGIIKNMYSTARSCVKLPYGVTDTFPIQKGIKQGDTLSPFLFNLYVNDINYIFTKRCDSPQLDNHEVRCLMYADDLLILSESQQGLQCAISKLKDYCTAWKLKLNVKKTKVIIFGCRKYVGQSSFMFGEEELQIVDKYSYLGMMFTSDGKMKEAVNTLHSKAMKGMFSLWSSLYTGITVKPYLPLHIFDSTVRPILTYGSEVWAGDFMRLLSKPAGFDKVSFEQVQNRFCKYILGLPKRASNFAAKAELGRAPLFTFMCSLALKYCAKLVETDTSRILWSAFQSELNIHKQGGVSWVSFIIKILELCDSDSAANLLNTNSDNLKGDIKKGCAKVRSRVTDLYHKFNVNNIGSHSKLRTYISFKKDFEMEPYLHLDNIPAKWRKLFCSLRVSCHDLEIERGRYKKNPKPPEERICKICNIEAETEEHFIMACPAYRKQRMSLLNKLSNSMPGIYAMEHGERFNYIMNNRHITSIKYIMEYINEIYMLRRDLIKTS